MKLCTKCNRLLNDSDLRCPNCDAQSTDSTKPLGGAGSVPLKTVYTEQSIGNTDTAIGLLEAEGKRYPMPEVEREAAPQDTSEIFLEIETTEGNEKPAAAKQIAATQAFTIEIPLGEVLEKLEREEKEKNKKKYTDKPAVQKTEEQSKKNAKAAGKVDDTAEFLFENIKKENLQEIDNTGIIEQELAVREQIKEKSSRKGFNKLGVSLFAVLIITVLVFSTLIVAKLVSKPEAIDENYYLTRLTGTWSGEPFEFIDDPDDQNIYMELLKINSDATFSLQYLIVNESVPKGYLDGEWDILEEFSGTVKILPDNATLALMYEQNGVKMVFIRDIVELEDNRIVLREYADDDDEYYYDMAFKRER